MQTSLMTMEMGETDREELDIRAELLHFKRTENGLRALQFRLGTIL